MSRKSAQHISEGESGRDSRLKPILLAVAVVLVAGYAAVVTRMGDFVKQWISGILGADLPMIPIAGAIAGVVVLVLAYLVLRRRGAGKPKKAKPAEVTDALAKLAGRQEFFKTLETQIDAHAKSGRQLAIHLIDIDRFRAVNEVQGEAEGDAFLRLLSERLLVLVNHADRLARVGDDEFVIIQPETGGARHAEIYARRIEETCKDACAQVPRHARPGASIGVAVYPDHGTDAGKLMRSASMALDAAKKARGNRFCVFSRAMEMEVEARLQMEQAISDGLHQGWFELNYQPQYDLQSRRLTGFEALVRMNHPEMGELLPDAFLPAAEGSGLMQPLGEWIIREAVTTAKDWPAHLALSINLSVAQLRHGDVAGTIINTLSQAEMDPARLHVEVSEGVLLDDTGAIAEQLLRLKTRGVTIVLDDFGLDSSRLKALARLACDAIKLDRSLIEHVGEEPETENLVRGLIGTAHAFDLGVMAEGIERAEQAQFLVANDCPNVQGFLFGRPIAAQDLGAVIAKDMRNVSGEPEAASDSADQSRSVA
jgi:diguanylate cyclase (GGDEF)-like protein